MKKWIKKYLILTLCFAIAVFPTFVILTQFDVLKDNRKYIFLESQKLFKQSLSQTII